MDGKVLHIWFDRDGRLRQTVCFESEMVVDIPLDEPIEQGEEKDGD